MGQVDVDSSIGYALKRVTWALRSEMDAHLQELDLSVSQYASLELLAAHPGMSNAELARGVFVTRQATHQLLTGMRRAGLVEIAGSGREQRISLTEDGAQRLRRASHAVAAVEARMLAGLSAEQQAALRESLHACAAGLAQPRD